jgi:flavin reductase (DIM6/NTAB) family NADH-FMN oxidoreductase RutF
MPRPHLIGPFPAGSNPTEYDLLRRRALWKMPSGLYLIGSRAGERRNLMTANWVTQVSREPKLLAVSVEREALTHDLIESGRAFAVSILRRTDRELVRKFVKPVEVTLDGAVLNGMPTENAPSSGAPVLTSAVGYLDCRLERSVELGSHTLFLGEIVGATLADDADEAAVLRMEDTRMHYGG